jgi:hypothetical protein
LAKPLKAPKAGTANLLNITLTTKTGNTAFPAGKTYYYRFVFISPFGTFAPSRSYRVDTPATEGCYIEIAFTRGSFSLPIQGVMIFRDEAMGKERLIGTSNQVFVFQDYNLPEGTELAADYEPIAKACQYLYTFKADGFESGPSAVSDPIPTVGATLLKFDILNDGFWEQPGLLRLDGLSATYVRGPLVASRKPNLRSDVFPLTPTAQQASRTMHGGLCSIWQTMPYLGSQGVSFYAGTSLFGKYRLAWTRDGVVDQARPVAQILDSADFPLDVTSVAMVNGGVVAGFSFDAIKGGLNVDLGPNSVGTGQKILFMQLDAPGGTTVTNRCVLDSFRSNLVGNFAWFTGEMRWAWAAGQTIAWAPEGLILGLTWEQAWALRDIEDGTFVRFSHPAFGDVKRYGRAFLSPATLFIQTDTNGLENLDLATGISGLSLDYYPMNNGIRARAVYRVGDTGEFLSVGEADLAADLFCDSASTTTLGAPPTSITTSPSGMEIIDMPPPPGLKGLVLHEQFLAGIKGNTVRWTRRGAPNAWPEQFQAMVPSPRALCSTEMGLLVLTSTGGMRLDGGDPFSLTLQKTEIEEGILAPRSVVNTPYGVAYLGSRGVVLTNGHTSKNITEERMRAWHFFPKRQAGPDGLTLGGLFLPDGRILDSSAGKGMAWVAFMESASVQGALAQDGLFGLVDEGDTVYASRAVGAFVQGKYLLFVPAHEAPEAFGTWSIDLKTGAILHLGLQPYAITSEGGDIYLLLPSSVRAEADPPSLIPAVSSPYTNTHPIVVFVDRPAPGTLPA